MVEDFQKAIKICDSIERDIRESDKVYIHVSTLKGLINRWIMEEANKTEQGQ